MLFEAFILQYSIIDKVPVNQLKYEFRVTEDSLFQLSQIRKEVPRTLTLKGISIALGSFDDDKLESNKDQNAPPFKPVDTLIAQVVQIPKDKKSSPNNRFNVPLYQQALITSMGANESVQQIHDGISNNFIWYIDFPTDENEEVLMKSGVSLFCRVPEQFL